MGNSFGKLFRITTWGESHGGAIGVVIDGCPPNLSLSVEDIQKDLDRRRPGQSGISTQRNEPDSISFISGVYQGKTLGTPLSMSIPNTDAQPEAYAEMADKFRPSHADFTYQAKYGLRNPEGGGRASARETAARVAAGSIAKKLLLHLGIEIRAYVESVQHIKAPENLDFPSIEEIDASPVRCPHPKTAEKMISHIEQTRSEGDSLGGTILCRIINAPPGLGSPVFDRLEADLAKAMLSIPASKGFEIGSGFASTLLKGSEHNDAFANKSGQIRTTSNNSGGIQGGMSNGEEIFFRVAFKPTATILKKQKTVNEKGKETEIEGKGRHDPCILPRAVPIVEAMAALTLLDHHLLNQSQNNTFNFK